MFPAALSISLGAMRNCRRIEAAGGDAEKRREPLPKSDVIHGE